MGARPALNIVPADRQGPLRAWKCSQPRADSTGRCNSLGERLRWCHPAEGLSRASVELGGDGVEVRLGQAREVGTLGQVLAEQAVGVLVGAPLPRAVRVAEVDGDAGLD